MCRRFLYGFLRNEFDWLYCIFLVSVVRIHTQRFYAHRHGADPRFVFCSSWGSVDYIHPASVFLVAKQVQRVPQLGQNCNGSYSSLRSLGFRVLHVRIERLGVSQSSQSCRDGQNRPNRHQILSSGLSQLGTSVYSGVCNGLN